MEEKLPRRPQTPDHDAIIGLELTLHTLLMFVGQNGGGHLEAMRTAVVDGLASARSEAGAGALEHMDWIVARAEAGLRRASP